MDRDVRCRDERRRGENPQGYRDQRFSSTMIYLHVMNRGALGVKSPMDRL